jgi:hypothetical protein
MKVYQVVQTSLFQNGMHGTQNCPLFFHTARRNKKYKEKMNQNITNYYVAGTLITGTNC